MKHLLEIAAFSQEAAMIAGRAGADRIELCVDYASGGLTPPAEMTRAVAASLDCPVFVMIRPRAGNFVYSEWEFRQMKDELLQARACGAAGFVFGILTPDGGIDRAKCAELISLAAPLPCTFHRAFDELPDLEAGLEALIGLGFQRVLTSGGLGSAPEHLPGLKSLVARAGNRIIVMPGGGVRPSNLSQLAAATRASEFHSAAINQDSDLPDVDLIRQMKECLAEISDQ